MQLSIQRFRASASFERRAATFTLCITSAVELRTRLTFGYETGEGRSETESSLERRRRSVQELRGISRRVTKRKAG